MLKYPRKLDFKIPAMYFLSVGMSSSCFEYLLGYGGSPSSGSLIRDKKAIRDRVVLFGEKVHIF